jgi:hypothetical protein
MQKSKAMEVLSAARLKTLIPKIRKNKFKNKNYEIIILKGFPGIWHHDDLIDWANENKIGINIIDFGLQIMSINFYTNKLKKIINKNYNSKKLILLGFSMGGLIAVNYAIDNDWKNIEKIITFATPFKGSGLAKGYKFLPGAKDMIPESDLLKKLSDKAPANKVICISSAKDELVINSGTFLPGSEHITLPVYTHADAQVVKNIKDVLSEKLLKYA